MLPRSARLPLIRLSPSGSRLPSTARLRAGVVAALGPTVRLTAAAVLAYVLSSALTPDLTDLTGPLTALLVVQSSLYATLRMSALRIVSVLVGVLIAIAVSAWAGLTWWSLALVVAASLLVGSLLRLGDSLLETPISAMLILAVATHDVAAETRVFYTLIGAGVGIAFSALVPSSITPRTAEEALRALTAEIAATIRHAGDEMTEGVDRRRVGAWLRQTYALLPLVEDAGRAIDGVEESRRLNPRSLAQADVVPALRSGLGQLERCLVSLRAMFQALEDEIPVATGHPSARGMGYDEELRGAFAVVLADMADAVEGFGRLVVAEAHGRQDEAERSLAETLEILRETRAILADLYFVDGRENPAAWLLRGSVLGGVEGVLRHLDVEDRARARARLADGPHARRVAPLTLPHLPRLGREEGTAGPAWPRRRPTE